MENLIRIVRLTTEGTPQWVLDAWVNCVLPLGRISRDQSVPRIAAVAAGVSISTPVPPVAARPFSILGSSS